MRKAILCYLIIFTLFALWHPLSATRSLYLSLATKADAITFGSTMQIKNNCSCGATIGMNGTFTSGYTLLALEGKCAFHWPTGALYGGLLTNRGALGLLFDTKTTFAINAGTATALATTPAVSTQNSWHGLMGSLSLPQFQLKIIPFGFVPLLNCPTPSGGGLILLGKTMAVGICHLSQNVKEVEHYHIKYHELAPSHLALGVIAFSTPPFAPFKVPFTLSQFSQSLRLGFSSRRGIYTSLSQEVSIQFQALNLLFGRYYEPPYPIQESLSQTARPLLSQHFTLQLSTSPWFFSLKGEQELFRLPIYANKAQKRRDTFSVNVQYNQQNWFLATTWSHTMSWNESGRYTHTSEVSLSLKVDLPGNHLLVVLKGDPNELLKSEVAVSWYQEPITVTMKLRYEKEQLKLTVQGQLQLERITLSLNEQRLLKATFIVQE